MQLKSWGRPSNAAGGFFNGLIHLMDWGFELQIVPPDMSFTALKRGDHKMSITKFTLVTKNRAAETDGGWSFFYHHGG